MSQQTRHCEVTLGVARPTHRGELLRTLESLMHVRFGDGSGGCQGEFVVGAAVNRSAHALRATPSLHVAESPVGAVAGSTVLSVRFADHALVPFPFRGRKAVSLAACRPRPLQPEPGEQVLAHTDDGPVWTASGDGASIAYRSAMAIADFDTTGSFSQVFCADRFIENLPLIEFLRLATSRGQAQTRLPPLRAAFMFDDPNLHWPTYGHVDYADIARHATAFNHHVSFATIPLDGWFVHAGTAALFCRERERLSLLVHGNNHLKHEMKRPGTEAERQRLVAQAIARIRRLEASSGLAVSRAMVPPHGACSASMLALLPRYGFDCACISAGSLIAHNEGQAWTRALGYLPSEWVEGCSVMPRSALTGNAENALLINAYLGQPMILRGHHGDLKGGLDRLGELADKVNSLGHVVWSDLTTLSRMSYQYRVHDRAVHVTPLSGCVRLTLPANTERIVVEQRLEAGASAMLLRHGAIETEVRPGVPVSVDAGDSSPIEVRRVVEHAPLDGAVTAGVQWSAVLRRLLTEGRDRFAWD